MIFLLIPTNSCTPSRIKIELNCLSQGVLVFRGGYVGGWIDSSFLLLLLEGRMRAWKEEREREREKSRQPSFTELILLIDT